MTQEGYINKASHNQKLIELLESQPNIDFPDWIVTALFYKSLHWINAWLISQGRPHEAFKTHGDTRNTINYRERYNKPPHACPVNKVTYEAYDDLFELSKTARYDGFLTEEAMKKLNQNNTIQGKRDVDIIKKFVQDRGIDVDAVSPEPEKVDEADIQ